MLLFAVWQGFFLPISFFLSLLAFSKSTERREVVREARLAWLYL